MNKHYYGEPSPNEIPDAYGLSGERVNSWQLFKDDELAREKYEDEEDDSSDFLDELGLDEDDLAYAKYQWEQSEKEDRRRGL